MVLNFQLDYYSPQCLPSDELLAYLKTIKKSITSCIRPVLGGGGGGGAYMPGYISFVYNSTIYYAD